MVDGILALKQRRRDGVEILPPAVAVRIGVGGGSVAVVRQMVDDPAFDRDVGADLENRLVGGGALSLPLRHYRIRRADEPRVTVEEAAGEAFFRLEIEGGDRGGEALSLPATAAAWRLGRGRWHGGDEMLANDLVVCHRQRFVSRRAAVLHRAGSSLEVESLDQGDFLLVLSADGRRMRPTHVPRRRVRVRPGDVIEFNDGGAQAIRLRLHRRRPDAHGVDDCRRRPAGAPEDAEPGR